MVKKFKKKAAHIIELSRREPIKLGRNVSEN